MLTLSQSRRYLSKITEKKNRYYGTVPLKCSIMVVESSFKDQNTRKLVFFIYVQIFNLHCCICELSNWAKSKQIMRHHARTQTQDIAVSCEWNDPGLDILVLKKIGVLLYVLCSLATFGTIVYTRKFGVVTTILRTYTCICTFWARSLLTPNILSTLHYIVWDLVKGLLNT